MGSVPRNHTRRPERKPSKDTPLIIIHRSTEYCTVYRICTLYTLQGKDRHIEVLALEDWLPRIITCQKTDSDCERNTSIERYIDRVQRLQVAEGNDEMFPVTEAILLLLIPEVWIVYCQP